MTEEKHKKIDECSDIQVQLRNAPWYNSVEITIEGFFPDKQGKIMVARPIEMVELPERERSCTVSDHFPTFAIGRKAAQVLMNDLWNAGFQPSKAQSGAALISATQHHLDDMRKIAFKKLGMEVTG